MVVLALALLLTERRLQQVSSFGAPPYRMNVWVICIDPKVIDVAPAIKMDLRRQGDMSVHTSGSLTEEY